MAASRRMKSARACDEIDVIGGLLLLPAQDAHQHARIVRGPAAVWRSAADGWRRTCAAARPPLALISANSSSSRSGMSMMRAPALPSAAKARSKARRDRRLEAVEHHGLRHRQPQALERECRQLARWLAGQHGIEHGATCDRSPRAGRSELSEGESGNAPCVGTRCAVGLKPTMPHSAAGIRQEPPVSVPSAPSAMPSVTETAAPDDEPPGMRPPGGRRDSRACHSAG